MLETYELERTPHVRELVTTAKGMGEVMTRGGLMGGALRRALLPLVTLLPGLRSRVVDSETPRLRRSDWVLRGRRDTVVGRLVPNLGPADQDLDSVLGSSWALITDHAPSPSDRDLLSGIGCELINCRRDSDDHEWADLAAWLSEAGVQAALVRPDRTVMAAGHTTELISLATLRLGLARTAEI